MDDDLTKDFQTINTYSSATITPTSDYYKWIASEKIKGLIFGFANSTFTESLEILKNTFEIEKKHYKKTNEAIDAIKAVAVVPYLSQENIKTLEQIFILFKENSWEKVIDTFSRYQSANLTKWSIDKLKNLYQNKKGIKVKPTQSGLVAIFENSLKLYNSSLSIREAMNKESKIERTVIGKLAEKGIIYREIEYSINPASYKDRYTKHFNSSITQVSIKAYKKGIDGLVSNSFSIKEQESIVEFKSSYEKLNIQKISDLLLCNTRIVDESNSTYDPSPGEKAMLLLNFKLMDDTKNVYILDEPEAKVGHKYISDVIIPRLLELSRRDKKIIITTHDANIAVRTLPLLSVYREQYREDSKIKYRTYIGSPFLDKMKCYEDSTREIDWVKTSMETLEGGEDAFIERGENYGK